MAKRGFIDGWVDSMPNTIIGLCTVGIIAVALAGWGLVVQSDSLALAAGLFGQVGTFLALGVGFVLDRKRMRDRRGR